MFSQLTQMNVTKVVYAGLTCCHFYGAFVTNKPLLYGTIAALYAVLVLQKK